MSDKPAIVVYVSNDGPDAFYDLETYEKSLRFSYHARPSVQIARQPDGVFLVTNEDGTEQTVQPKRVTVWNEVVHL